MSVHPQWTHLLQGHPEMQALKFPATWAHSGAQRAAETRVKGRGFTAQVPLLGSRPKHPLPGQDCFPQIKPLSSLCAFLILFKMGGRAPMRPNCWRTPQWTVSPSIKSGTIFTYASWLIFYLILYYFLVLLCMGWDCFIYGEETFH